MAYGTAFLVVVAWPESSVPDWARVSCSARIALAYGGILVAGFGYDVFWTSIREIGAIRTVIYHTLVAPIALVIAVLALGEALTLQKDVWDPDRGSRQEVLPGQELRETPSPSHR